MVCRDDFTEDCEQIAPPKRRRQDGFCVRVDASTHPHGAAQDFQPLEGQVESLDHSRLFNNCKGCRGVAK